LGENTVFAEKIFLESVNAWTCKEKEERQRKDSLNKVKQCASSCWQLAQNEENKEEAEALSISVEFIERAVEAFHRKEFDAMLPDDEIVLSSYVCIYGSQLGWLNIYWYCERNSIYSGEIF